MKSSQLEELMNACRRHRRRRRKMCSTISLLLYLTICFYSQALASTSYFSVAQPLNASGQQHKREVTRGGDGEYLEIPYPARKFQHIWSSKEELAVLLDRQPVVLPPSPPPKTTASSAINSSNGTAEAPTLAKLEGMIENNPLLKSLNMFNLDRGDSHVMDITSPNLQKPLDSKDGGAVTSKKVFSKQSSLPLKRSVLKKFSVGVDNAGLATKLGSDATVAKAYASLTGSRTQQQGLVDNFDEIYQKQPYPPLPPPRTGGVADVLSATTLTTPASSITDYISSVTRSLSTTSTPQFTTKVLADEVPSSTPFEHTLFEEEASRLAAPITPSSSPRRSTILPVFTATRSIRKQSTTKKTLHSSGSTTSSVLLKKESGTTVGQSLISTTTPAHYAPTTGAGKFFQSKGVEEGITPPHWNIEMGTEQQPFEVTDSLELALSTASPSPTTTPQMRNESSKKWWPQQLSSNSQPTSSAPPTTSLPLSRSSLVMMQQEEYPKEKLSSSKKQLYPWERQRELLVPFPSYKSGQSDPLGKQVTFGERNLKWEKSEKSEEQHLSTLQPFPPIMPGASFYVDQHVSHGYFGREPDGNGHPAVVYDPNVLQSRYGFSGMLPQSGASVIAPLTAFKKNRKATTFGVQNLPIGGAGEAPFTNGNKKRVDTSNAVFFFIPIPKRLSTAKAIKIRNQGNSTFISDKPVVARLPFLKSATTELPDRFPTLVHHWEDLPQTTDQSPHNLVSDRRRTMGMEGNHLNWRPLGSGPKKLGPVKLVPLPSLMEGNSVVEGGASGPQQPLGRKLEVESYDDYSPSASTKCSRLIATGASRSRNF